MDAIELMVSEHKNIKRMLKVIRVMCIKVLNNENVDFEDFYKVIDFVRNYADKHHHAKEENILFKKMGDELGEVIAKGPVAGMFVEHDMGRHYMANLEAALEKFKAGDKDSKVDIIANAISYTELLNRHIDKEDTAIYSFARRALSKAAMEAVEQSCSDVENSAAGLGTQDKYITLVEEFEKKFL
jgi:hemerythrin-like domain-containing protein